AVRQFERPATILSDQEYVVLENSSQIKIVSPFRLPDRPSVMNVQTMDTASVPSGENHFAVLNDRGGTLPIAGDLLRSTQKVRGQKALPRKAAGPQRLGTSQRGLFGAFFPIVKGPSQTMRPQIDA